MHAYQQQVMLLREHINYINGLQAPEHTGTAPQHGSCSSSSSCRKPCRTSSSCCRRPRSCRKHSRRRLSRSQPLPSGGGRASRAGRPARHADASCVARCRPAAAAKHSVGAGAGLAPASPRAPATGRSPTAGRPTASSHPASAASATRRQAPQRSLPCWSLDNTTPEACAGWRATGGILCHSHDRHTVFFHQGPEGVS